MTTLLTLLTVSLFLAFYLNRTTKRVLIKPVAKSGLVGPELLAEKTRLDVWREWLRPWAWGVVVGAVMWPACTWLFTGVVGWVVE